MGGVLRTSLLFLLLPISVLSLSCTLSPDQSDVTRVESADIINSVRCETKAAIAQYPDLPLKVSPDYKSRVPDTGYNPIIITYDFEFISEENNMLSAGATYVMPIHLGTLSIDVGGGADRTRKGTDNITISETFAELRRFPCEQLAHREARRFPILGNLGVERLVWSYFRLMPLAAGSQEFNKAFYFKLKLNAGAKPSIAIVPLPKHKLDADIDAKVHRFDVHEVKVTLKAEKKKEDKVLSDAEKIWQKTVYVRFIDAFDDKGNIRRGPDRPLSPRADAIEGLPPPPPPPRDFPDKDSIERAKERAQREAIDNRNARELRRLRRELLDE